MGWTRRGAVLSLMSGLALGQAPQGSEPRPVEPDPGDSDIKLPNGKSQRDAIAEAHHKQALKDAQQMVSLADEIKSELEKAGNFVVPVSTLKKVDQVERLAKHIRGSLKS